VLFAEQPLAVKINFLAPQPGECFWITKHREWTGSGKKRHSVITWDVSPTRPAIHEPAENGQPSDVAVAAEATGIPETQLERQVRESVEVRQKAAESIRAKINLEKRGDAIPVLNTEPAPAPHSSGPAPNLNSGIERRPPQTANGRPQWAETLINQTAELIDAYAECRQRAAKHGTLVSADDVRTLLVTNFIGLQQRRRA